MCWNKSARLEAKIAFLGLLSSFREINLSKNLILLTVSVLEKSRKCKLRFLAFNYFYNFPLLKKAASPCSLVREESTKVAAHIYKLLQDLRVLRIAN